MTQTTKKKHQLILYPNAWMRAFGIEEDQVKDTNDSIMETLNEFETEARVNRSKKGWKTKGREKLARERLTLDYTPRKDSRRIFVYALCKEVRIRMIEEYRFFCDQCCECYERWKIGDYRVEWPPGAFLPAMPPRYNVISI